MEHISSMKKSISGIGNSPSLAADREYGCVKYETLGEVSIFAVTHKGERNHKCVTFGTSGPGMTFRFHNYYSTYRRACQLKCAISGTVPRSGTFLTPII